MIVQATEIGNFDKNFQDTKKKISSNNDDREKKVPKEMAHLLDQQLSDFKKETKRLLKEQIEVHKDEVKKEKTRIKSTLAKKQRFVLFLIHISHGEVLQPRSP